MVLKKLFGKKDEEQKNSADSASRSGASATEAPQTSEGEQPLAQATGNEPAAAVHLEYAMIENARNDTPDTRQKVYQELLFGDLLLALADAEPAQEGQPAPEPQTQADGNMSVAILTNSAGVRFAAAFTSPQAARRWRPEGGNYVSVRGQDIYKLLEPSPAEVIVINAGSAPFIVLPKMEYRQLAMGIVPQTGRSPVQLSMGDQPQDDQANSQMQLAFPPDVFTDEQKSVAKPILEGNERIEAAVLGAILPPGADQQTGWVRTLFLRVNGVDEAQEAMQQFCVEVRNEIVNNQEIFKDTAFEVGVMPDPAFWVHMHQNNIVIFDRNPPPIPAAGEKEGVVNAEMEERTT